LTLKPLPAELVRALQDAVLTGNKRLLDRLIGEVRERVGGDPANRLAALAGRYEYDALTKLLEEACL
jgi:hypothetical protein